MSNEVIQIRPQPGAQEVFLSTKADIAIYGGSAGSGKTYALLMEAVRHVENPNFGAVFLRRTYPQIMGEGGLWDSAKKLYLTIGGEPFMTPEPHFRFPSGATVSFRSMQREDSKYDWQGTQVPLIIFDELTHFSWGQFMYMLSRNRSTCGVEPYIRATCNPDSDHWLRGFIDWWIGKDGFPIKERSGVVRYMVVMGDEIMWADTPEELIETYGEDAMPLSVVFIAATLDDNKEMLKVDPRYKARLLALPKFERDQLLYGNWNVRQESGMFFKREWFNLVSSVPPNVKWVRYWDRAATEPSPSNPDPDYTVGALMGRTPDGRFIIADIARFRGTPQKVEATIKRVAANDGVAVDIGLEQEPGASGKFEAQYLVRELAGYVIRVNPKRISKVQAWSPLSAQAEAGNVDVLRAPWNEAMFKELEDVDGSGKMHDDQVDALSGAFNMIHNNTLERFKCLAS